MPPFKTLCYDSLRPGPRLVVLGAVHGNETCGTRAIERVTAELDAGTLAITAGSVSFVPVTNPMAYAAGRRAGDRNLNRNLAPTAAPREFEDRIANALCPLLQRHDVLLDLHSFHAPGQPFVMVGPENNHGEVEPFARAAEEEALALRLGVHRVVEGWLGTYARGVAQRGAGGVDYGVGTTEYMRRQGGIALTLECGQHDDPQAPEVAYRAVRATLAHLRLVAGPPPGPAADVQALCLTDVVDRAHAADRFARAWSSFDAVCEGELLAVRADGRELRAERDGHVVFPNPGAEPGQEWFYFASPSARFATSASSSAAVSASGSPS